MTIVTTSWDDGHVLDKKLSTLLDKYNVRGTFYIAKEYLNSEGLNDEEIKNLSARHEIGAHTIHHQLLSKINIAEAREEIIQSKQWVESVTGKPCKSFCYPAGFFNDEIKKITAEAGFIEARTVEAGSFTIGNDLFEINPTLQVYPFPFRKNSDGAYLWIDLFRPLINNKQLLKQLGLPALTASNWAKLAKKSFDHARATNGVFHVWGHSWEIEKYHMWGELEDVLNYISNRDNTSYLTNSELCGYDTAI